FIIPLTLPLTLFPYTLLFRSPLLSMAQLLGIPRHQPPYLFASAERLEFWKERIAKIPGFKIGIAWQGAPILKPGILAIRSFQNSDRKSTRLNSSHVANSYAVF